MSATGLLTVCPVIAYVHERACKLVNFSCFKKFNFCTRNERTTNENAVTVRIFGLLWRVHIIA